ncbi:hypothetical protein BK634_29815 [Pseudomonas chlororaphis]|jgi:hypothetical protein|uniref:Secreted protein n=1 Tax=Pseudomonas morbosilactucae TaxID=2938197 RepID=A0ABT0JM01_9PSED|nr:hypothetical protein [Pseudomonas morbosilactucae]MCK9816968.1 hypothetical protein [Pseudomonas morbosilactucae]ROL64353.1 hypothetical protein BK634_29815 [Pseudomonas chlororaphis]WEK10656.1 MAG: hypothetical protein P0Y51_07330 [Pseudomonas sp.]
MKRSALAGLFITATMLASPVFAAAQEDLCQINLQKIKDAKVSTEVMSEQLSADVDASVQQATAEKAKGTEEGTKNCISITTQAIQKLQNNTKGDQ